ncbi:hypothetical protein FSARC_13001 [Fusarium sarcochroum]|uniref:Nucleoside phosphorylase domain-containing protein n=1 Tax=Fusarium sarcochroum TaxID=1208366 RepID=A0A8H4T4D9_9HYPO|nr:hypothetical protein FSARC_13001 [Fusarium sarcochroum]
MEEKYRMLFREAQRQMKWRSDPNDGRQPADICGLIRPEQLGERYHNELVQLQQILSDLQEACGLTRQELYTDDIWKSPQLHDWAKGEQSSLLLVQSSYNSISRTERFSAELFDLIQDKQPIVAILQSPSSTEFIASSEGELLRQLAIQALQKVSVDDPISFLADALLRFMGASTCEDWFAILEWILQMTPSLFLVTDMSVLGERVEKARSWLIDLEKIMTRLQTTSATCLRILLISTYPIWSDSDLPNLLFIGAAPELDMDYEMSGIGEMSPQRKLPIYLPARDAKSSLVTQPNQSTKRDQAQGDSVQKQREETSLAATQPHNQPGFQSVDIAILCALPLEADAVEVLFDVHFTGRYCRAEGDTNTYSLGVIDRHNVVLVHMPGMGTRHAASVAAHCGGTFPRISLVLIVGICGGVPFLQDGTELMLGDVAVSEGLVTYDFGRQYPDRFVRKDSILESARKPPAEILGFLARLKGRNAKRILHERTAVHMETLRRELGTSAIYPGADKDVLFKSEYRHKHHDISACDVCAMSEGPMRMICEQARISTCEELKCDAKRSITRQRQQEILQSIPSQQSNFCPTVHFGKYASGDKVMKSGEDRDEIARSEGIIAFEMEGAGVWDNMPCVIIKGVCDYADSHKDKRWQGFAAATAAACMRAFLERWRQ